MSFKNWLLLETDGPHKFSCVMAQLPSIKNEIVKWSKKNIPETALCEEEGGREDDTHVTVLYGLHTNNPSDIKPILAKFSPFNISFQSVSKFEAENYDVLKIGINSHTLHKMNEKLRELPYTTNHPKYVPHCTLAYVKKKSCDHLLNDDSFSGLKVIVNDITFSPAEGDKSKIKLS